MDLPQYEDKTGKCSLCGGLPDNLCVNTGRDFQFPDAFRKLVRVGVAHDSQGQTTQLCRCPDCGSCFEWQALPQMYGSGNNEEERLIRFSPQASRLLDNFLAPEPQIPVDDPAEIEEYAELLSPEMFLEVLERHVGKNPNFVTPFVPKLVSFFGRDLPPFFYNRVKSLLDAYISDSPKRQTEVEAAQAQFAFRIMTEHFARANAVMDYPDPPRTWSSFNDTFWLNTREFVEKGQHARMMISLLDKLVAFFQALDGRDFTERLYYLLRSFGPDRLWLAPILPESAKVKVDAMQEMYEQHQEDEERFRLDQLYY